MISTGSSPEKSKKLINGRKEYSLVIRRNLHKERLMLPGKGMSAGQLMYKRLTLELRRSALRF
jgi:hypothetical protein